MSKSRDTLKRMNTNDDNDCDDVHEEVIPNKSKKTTIAEKKLDLLKKCTDAITAQKQNTAQPNVPQVQKLSSFATYIDEKLSELNKHKRRIAEKRITDILFDIEMAANASPEETINPQWDNFTGYYQTPPRMHQGISRMPAPMNVQPRGIPQQREATVSYFHSPHVQQQQQQQQPGHNNNNLEKKASQSYVEYINE